jgi:L-malate glycosyltransferase
VRRLRIAYVVGSLTVGGSERQMLALAERLPADRFSVDFILLGTPGPYAARARAAGATIISLGAHSRTSGSFLLFAVRASMKVLRFVRIARARRYDIIDAWLFPSYGLAALTRPLTRAPILVAGRRSLNDFKEQFGPLERLLDRIARGSADAIVANSRAVAADVSAREGLRASSVLIIPNGIEEPPSVSAAECEARRQRWGATGDEIVIGCVSNLREGKGHSDLLAAFRHVVATHRATRLVLVGDGVLRDRLEAEARAQGVHDRVVFAGSVLDPRPLYPAFDIVVHASESEGLPNAVLEAAAAGCAIVATSVGGTPEIIEDGRTGLLVPAGDRRGLTRAITELVERRERRVALGSAAKAHVLAAFGMDRFVREFVELYEDLARRKGIAT